MGCECELHPLDVPWLRHRYFSNLIIVSRSKGFMVKIKTTQRYMLGSFTKYNSCYCVMNVMMFSMID